MPDLLSLAECDASLGQNFRPRQRSRRKKINLKSKRQIVYRPNERRVQAKNQFGFYSGQERVGVCPCSYYEMCVRGQATVDFL